MEYRVAIFFLLLSAGSALSEEECRDVVRLSFATVRDGLPSDTTPFPLSTGIPCDHNHVKVLCSDTGYPNDIFCDLGRIKFHSNWKSNTSVVGVELTYKHPSVESYCTAKLTSSGEEGTGLVFIQAECYPLVDDQVLPHFLVSDVRVLKITTTTPPGGEETSTTPREPTSTTPGERATSATSGGWTTSTASRGGTTSSEEWTPSGGGYHEEECFHNIYNFGVARPHGGVKGGASRARRTVKFDLTYSNCQSASTTLIGGRPPEKAVFSHTGRRYRPT